MAKTSKTHIKEETVKEAREMEMRRESELASRKLPGLQQHLVIVRMGCPHVICSTEAGMQNNLWRCMPVDLVLCET
eukprot:4282097-Ditylum_brightwellii.AAC.1